MSEVKLSRTVAAPVQRVWDVFVDLENAASWLSAVERIEVLTPGAFKVGTTWRETRNSDGRTTVGQLTVTICEPLDRCVVEARRSDEHIRAEFQFTPQDEATTLVDMTLAKEAQGVGKVVGVVLGGRRDRAVAKAMQRDLDDLAAAAEAH